MTNQMKDIQPIELLLNKVSSLLEAQALVKENYEARVTDDFSPIDLFAPDEPTLSSVLAYLLNPKQGHGQGSLFLNQFCEALKQSRTMDSSDSQEASMANKVQVPELSKDTLVQCEYSTDEGRLDLLLKDSNGLIVIENKPWASEGEDQLERYARWANRQNSGNAWLLVFISEYEPSSLPKNSPYRQKTVWMTFTQLVDILQESARFSKSLLVRDFVEIFVRYLKKNVIGESMITNEQLVGLLTRPENICATAEIINIREQVIRSVWDKFIKNLTDECKNRYNGIVEFDGSASRDIGNKWLYLIFKMKNPNNWGIEFSLEGNSSNLNGWCWGVATLDNKVFTFDTNRNLHTALREELMIPLFKDGAGRKNKYWPWWVWGREEIELEDPKYFPKSLLTSRWFAQMTQEGETELTELIFKKIDLIVNYINEKPDLKSKLMLK